MLRKILDTIFAVIPAKGGIQVSFTELEQSGSADQKDLSADFPPSWIESKQAEDSFKKMPSRWMRGRSLSDHFGQRGAVLIEFAIIMPILITIILTTLELGIMLAIKVNLQSCVQAGAYYGESGGYTAGSTRTASAQAVMMQGVWGTLDSTKLVVTIQSFPTFAIASTGLLGTTGTGSAGQVGMYQMQYSYTPVTPLVAAFFGATKVLTATTYVKNEESFPT